MKCFQKISLLRFSQTHTFDVSSVINYKIELVIIIQGLNTDFDAATKKLLIFTSRIDFMMEQSIHLYKDCIFDILLSLNFHLLTPTMRKRIYKLTFNLADMVQVPQQFLLMLQNFQNNEELSLFIDISTQISDFSIINYIIVISQNSQTMKKIAPSVVTFFLDAYKLVDCSVIFALYIQYFHQQNINFEFIDVEIVKQTALSNFFYCRIGLSFCLQFDLQVPINVLFDNLASMDYKIQILAMKICLISELIVFKSAISECYLQVRADYRVGNFDLLDIEIMMEKSGNFEDLNILID